ncbi:MAG: putative Ig domain-containing protein [Candidatus Saccharimonadales bacterium]
MMTRRGFTIVELLVVIVVIGILASIGIVSYGAIIQKSDEATIKTGIGYQSQLVRKYFADNNKYPATLADTGQTDSSTPNITYVYVYDAVAKDYCLSGKSNRNSSPSFKVNAAGDVTAGECSIPAPNYTYPTLTQDFHPCYPAFPNYSYTYSATGDGTITYAVQSGALPPAFTLNSATGNLSGVVASPVANSGTTYNFVIAATNSGGSATQSVTLTLYKMVCPP